MLTNGDASAVATTDAAPAAQTVWLRGRLVGRGPLERAWVVVMPTQDETVAEVAGELAGRPELVELLRAMRGGIAEGLAQGGHAVAVDGEGAFALQVPPGRYVVLARAAEHARAEVPLTVGEEGAHVEVPLAFVGRGELGLLLLDAFSSDAIPTHLLTREALQLYLSRLRPDGLVLVHISNRYFDLGPVLGRLADELGLVATHWQDADGYADHDDRRVREGLQASHWVLLARRREHLPALPNRWKPLLPGDAPLWTDDYTDLLATLGKD